MVWTDITNGTLPDATKVMGNFNEEFRKIAANAFGQIYIEANQTIANQKTKDLTVDTFTDSDGYYDTVNATTTAYYNSGTDSYDNQVVSALSSENRGNEDGSGTANIWTSTINEDDVYVSYVQGRAQATGTVTINIKNGSTLIASDSVATTANNGFSISFVPGDYSSFLDKNDTLNIQLTGSYVYNDTSGTGTTDNYLVTSTDSSTFTGYFQVRQNTSQAKDLDIDLPTLQQTPTKIALFLDYYQDDYDETYLTWDVTSAAGTDSAINIGEVFTQVNATGKPTSLTVHLTADTLQKIKGFCLLLIE